MTTIRSGNTVLTMLLSPEELERRRDRRAGKAS